RSNRPLFDLICLRQAYGGEQLLTTTALVIWVLRRLVSLSSWQDLLCLSVSRRNLFTAIIGSRLALVRVSRESEGIVSCGLSLAPLSEDLAVLPQQRYRKSI